MLILLQQRAQMLYALPELRLPPVHRLTTVSSAGGRDFSKLRKLCQVCPRHSSRRLFWRRSGPGTKGRYCGSNASLPFALLRKAKTPVPPLHFSWLNFRWGSGGVTRIWFARFVLRQCYPVTRETTCDDSKAVISQTTIWTVFLQNLKSSAPSSSKSVDCVLKAIWLPANDLDTYVWSTLVILN